MPRRSIVVLLTSIALAGCAPGPASSTTPSSAGRPSPSAPESRAPSSGPAAAGSAGPTLPPRTDGHGVDQVWVPAGSFRMGSAEGSAEPPTWARAEFAGEQPAHDVRLTRGFWIDRTEVTVASYTAFVTAGGYGDRQWWSDAGWAWLDGRDAASLPDPCTGTLDPAAPQVCVTWYEAEAYAAWRGGRLPTEAEWEFAARGPEGSVYPWGNAFDPARANLVGASGPVPVGSYPAGASWVGALDMAGNAMEWVADWYSATYYRQAPPDDPTGPEIGGRKVEKGGWWGAPDPAFVARSAYRHFEDAPDYEDHHIGFRVVTPAT